MAKCFHVYEPFCKVKQFTKRYSHLKILHGVFSYETVAFFQISLTLTVLVCMLAVLLGDDLRIIILINCLCSALCPLWVTKRSSCIYIVFPVFSPRWTFLEELLPV